MKAAATNESEWVTLEQAKAELHLYPDPDESPKTSNMSWDEMMNRIADILSGMDGETVSRIYNEHLAEEDEKVEYTEDGNFTISKSA